jgi:apolipoprotein D and lipocalin family protein
MTAENGMDDAKSELKKAADNLKVSTSGNPGQRLGYWLAAGAVVATGAAWAYSTYRRKQQEKKALSPATVAHVDVRRYMGRWFEIARIPYRFEKGATDVQAFYTLEKSGKVRVENYAIRKGKTEVARGSARVVDKATNAKLKVSFFWPFEGDYWILGLGENYEWALVGGPTGDYLWILSRTATMGDALKNRILELARSQGFDTGRLLFTSQNAGNMEQVLGKERQDGHAFFKEQPSVGADDARGEKQPEVLYPDIE